MEEFNDWHLYFNSFCRYKNQFGTYQCQVKDAFSTGRGEIPYENFKPVLRRLSDITNEELKEYNFIVDEATSLKQRTKKIKWLLDNHFDLFNLIENGEAIDANTLTINPYKV